MARTKNIKIMAITLALVLILISSIYVLLQPGVVRDTIQIQGAWSGTLTWKGWRDQDGLYRTGYSGNPFYVGDTLQGRDWSFTLKGDIGYSLSKWKMEGELQDNNGNRIHGIFASGGAMTNGQTVDVICNINYELTKEETLRYEYVFSGYNSQVGWEGMSSGSGSIQIHPNLPHFTLDYYEISATTVKAGDIIDVFYQFTNDGRASGTLSVYLWVDKWNEGEYYGNMKLYTKKSEQIAVGGTVSDTVSIKILDEYASNDNVFRLGLNDVIKQITYTPPMYSLTVVTVPTKCLVTVSDKSSGSDIAGATFNLVKGTYSVTVSKDKYYPKIQTVVLTETKTITVALSEIFYNLEINTTPLSKVEIKNVDTKYADEKGIVFFKLVPNTYAIVISKSGYITKSLSIPVDKNMTYAQVLEKITSQGTTPPSSSPSPKTPGFDTVLFIVALGITILIFINRRKRIQ